jgi:hypothetical protein
MEQSISVMVTGAIIAGGVAGLVSVGGAVATVSFLRQSFTEFKQETASAFRDLWKKEGEQDGRLNTVERKHEGLEREHKVLTREHRVHHGGEAP